MVCLGSPRLIARLMADGRITGESSEYADEGTAAHHLAEAVLADPARMAEDFIGQVFNKRFTVDREMADAVQTYCNYVNGLEADEKHFESRVRYEQYVKDGFGTSDTIALDYRNGVLHVADLKYGEGVKVFAHESRQLLLYALGAILQHPGAQLFNKVVLHVVQPRLDHIDVWETTIDRVWEHAEEARVAALRTEEPDAPLVPSEKGCQFCDAKPLCPKLAEIARIAARSEFDPLDAETMTNEEVLAIYDQAKAVDRYYSAVRAFVYAETMAGRMPGKKLVEGRSDRAWQASPKVEETLLTFLPESVVYATKMNSPAQIEKAIGKKQFRALADLVRKPPGRPVLADEDDPREAVNAMDGEFEPL